MDINETIEIPFGAKESELKGWEYTIPEGMEAVIENGKIIVRQKESEDERIRKFLVDYFEVIKSTLTDGMWKGFQIDKILALLEKPGEQKSDSFKAEHGKHYYCIKDYFSGGKKQASKGDVVQALRGLPIMGLDDASEFFLPVNDMPLNNGIDHIASPKFKVGDWVVLSSGSLSETLQIVRIDIMWKLYWFDDDSYLPIVDEDCLHLWRPQDAEDGDILVITKDGDPFIFKGFLDKFHPDSPVAYGGIISNGTFDISSGDGWWDGGEISPANKEQRDLLFQKMKEAGYEWDAEKKELKTIEHNPADNIELSAFKDKLLELFQKFRWFKKGVPTNGDIIEYVDTHIQELINTIHNPAWSEEDEKNELKPIE